MENRKLRILMMTSHRRFKCDARGYPMAKHLVERGHDVTMVVTADRRRLGIVEADWDGVWTVETPDLLWGRLRSGLDPWETLIRLVYQRTDERRYDLIHCFETRPTSIYPALFYKRRQKLPIITNWIDWFGRGGIIDELRPRWYRALFGRIETYFEEAFHPRADGVVVIARALGDRARELGVQPARICYLPNGSWPSRSTVPESAACRRRVGLDVAGPVIGFSSLDSHLDLALIMEVLAQIVAKYPDAQLLITGHAPQRISDLARTYGVEKHLILTGFLPYEEFPWYLGCCDLFVMPFPDKIYNIGRWPSKVNDYMSVGRPTVSNPVGDVGELFEKHKIGLLAEWDSEDFAQKIIFLLEHPDIAGEMGRNARRAAETEYNWKQLIRELEKFYYRILDMGADNSTILQDSSPASA
jgi:glycosyltransferase involved in cell wall biosynthesis